MPLTDFTSFRLNWSDLPLWRKICVLSFLGLFLYLGQGSAYDDIKIFSLSPNVPTGDQKYPVRVMHGSLRYVTEPELKRFSEYANRANFVGVPLVLAFVLLATNGKTKPIKLLAR